jgi:hypothetical protein
VALQCIIFTFVLSVFHFHTPNKFLTFIDFMLQVSVFLSMNSIYFHNLSCKAYENKLETTYQHFISYFH